MYNLYKVVYKQQNSGYILGIFYFIAKSEEELKTNSKFYSIYQQYQSSCNQIIEITTINHITDLLQSYHIENLNDFEVTLSIRRKGETNNNVV